MVPELIPVNMDKDGLLTNEIENVFENRIKQKKQLPRVT